MRILAVNQFYKPDMSATSQLLTELCEDLAAGGDEVSVIACRGGYFGGDRLAERERLAGVQVIRPWSTRLGKERIAFRLADYLSFWTTAISAAARTQRPDVMLALTTPPMIASGVAAVARARKVPLVSWVQDVYPEVAVAFGLFSQRHPISRSLRLVNRATHRAATLSVAISDGMAERLEVQGQTPHKIRVAANWADGELLQPMSKAHNTFRKEHALQDRFVVMYSGNLGVGHDFTTLMDAARRLGDSRPQVLFLFVGQGGRKAEAERLARGLSNVRFLPYQPRERLPESLSAADVHVASLRPHLDGLLVPSKLYGVMAVGRPLFYVGPERCELSQVIKRHRIGWAGRMGDVDGLCAALTAAADDPEETHASGMRARQVFEAQYDRPHAVARWREVLAEAAQTGRK